MSTADSTPGSRPPGRGPNTAGRRSARSTRRSAVASSKRKRRRGGAGGGPRTSPERALVEAGLPVSLPEALDDPGWDVEIQAETDEALALTGKDVGTPILHFQPPVGVAFFGPVIGRLPDDDAAVALWDHVVGLAGSGPE